MKMNFDNVDFSNPATIPIILLLTVACQNEELTEKCKKYLEEYKEKLKENNNVQSIQEET
jgi:hypothetical protein